MRAVGFLTEEVDSAFGNRYSSTGASLDNAEGLLKLELDKSSETWLFLRCSGVIRGESGCDDGASVGEDDVDCDSTTAGSNSRSGRGGVINGRRVVFRIMSRRIALPLSLNKVHNRNEKRGRT